MQIPFELDISRATAMTVCVDIDKPLHNIATDGTSHLYVVPRYKGTPLGARLIFAPVDPFPARFLVDELASFAWHIQRERLRLAFEPKRRTDKTPTASIIVCTRDRPQYLRRCLKSLTNQDPPVEEIIVVDNGSNEETPVIASNAGARYIRESGRGLARARNRGISVALSEVVLFTDDDVEVDCKWSRQLLERFSDPLVMEATGLVLPARLDSPGRWLMEVTASHSRGFDRQVFDGNHRSPVVSSIAGVGASMAFRTEFLRAIGGFVESLGAGMPTHGGEDTYASHAVLRAGYRIAYEPAAIAYHWHRESLDEIRRLVHQNGVAQIAYLLHTGVCDRDPAAVQILWRTGRYITKKLIKSVARRPSAAPLRLVVRELIGMLTGPLAFVAARRLRKRSPPIFEGDRRQLPAPWLDGSDVLPAAGDARDPLPKLSVVIPTRGRRDRVLGLLRVLDRQEYPDESTEVIVSIDGDIDGTAEGVGSTSLRRTPRIVVGKEQGGPGAARNRGAEMASGEILLFLDDDVLPLHDQVFLAHARAHAEGPPGVVLGPWLPDARDAKSWLVQGARNWWVDQVERLRSSTRFFTDVCGPNLSIPRTMFQRLGGFVEIPHSEDWEMGFRLLDARIPVVVAWEAPVLHMIGAQLRNAWRNWRLDGLSDFAVSSMHPRAFWSLRVASWADMRRRGRFIVRHLTRHPRTFELPVRVGVLVLSILERAALREQFGRLYTRLYRLSFWSGVGEAAGHESAWSEVVACANAAKGQPLTIEVAASNWDRPKPDAPADLLISSQGYLVGMAPLRWGDVPWDGRSFAERVSNEFAWDAVLMDSRP